MSLSRPLEAQGRTVPATDAITEIAFVLALWAVVVSAVATIRVDDGPLRQGALFVHLVSLTVGFGGVIVVDMYALLWVVGRRTARDLVGLTSTVNAVVSAGLAGLLASGVVLDPDLTSGPGRLKMALVLVVMLNGVNVHRYSQKLRDVATDVCGDRIPWDYVTRGVAIAAISQVAWWGTIVIGFLTSASRQG